MGRYILKMNKNVILKKEKNLWLLVNFMMKDRKDDINIVIDWVVLILKLFV